MEAQKDEAVGHIPSGLFIICAKDEATQKVDGFLASWVQQVSFEPMLLMLAIKPGRPATESIMSGRPFTINIVGEHDRSFLKYFWKGYDPDNSPFESDCHYSEPDVGTVLLQGAKSAIVCELHSLATPGDHNVIFAKVKKSFILHEESRSLVHLRKTGRDY